MVGYTRNDLDMWSDVVARTIRAAGGRPGMMAHIAYGYGLFTGGLGYHYGAERLGCTVVPVSGGMTERQVQLICDFEPDILMATPSYALCLVDEFRAQGLDPRRSSLKLGSFGAEPWTNAMRDELEDAFDIDALDSYGLSEVIGPGVAGECVETKDGLHIWEDHFYPEIVDPKTGAVKPDGEFGELVLTSLTKEAMPVIRYRTGDLTRLLPGTARSMRRMEKISGRSDDMMIVRGVNVFPTQIEELAASRSRAFRPLPDRPEPRRPARPTGGSGRGAIVVRIGRGARACGERARARDQGAHRRQRASDRARAGGDRAIGRQGKARHRQEAEGMTSAQRRRPRWRCARQACPSRAVQEWSQALPAETGDYEFDARRFGAFWSQSAALLRTLPHKAAAKRGRAGGRGRADRPSPAPRARPFSPPTSMRSTTA